VIFPGFAPKSESVQKSINSLMWMLRTMRFDCLFCGVQYDDYRQNHRCLHVPFRDVIFGVRFRTRFYKSRTEN